MRLADHGIPFGFRLRTPLGTELKRIAGERGLSGSKLAAQIIKRWLWYQQRKAQRQMPEGRMPDDLKTE